MKLVKLAIFIFSLALVCSCGKEKNEPITDRFNRQQMLEHWADELIIPGFQAYSSSLEDLKLRKDNFIATPNTATFDLLTDAWLTAYKAWQHVAMYDIGKAEEIKLQLYTNTYPTNTTSIDQSIQGQNYNLELPSTKDIQGFPALDYLLFGLDQDKAEVINLLSTTNHSAYLNAVVDRLAEMGTRVHTEWQTGYRASFVANNGSSATAAVDKLVNDFLYYYEKFLRAGKIGIPAGIFSGSALSSSVEAPYSEIYSKALFLESFDAVQDFFGGKSFDGQRNGSSLEDYLDYANDHTQTGAISQALKDQWKRAETKAGALSNSFKDQVETDNIKMLETYDELQKAIVIMKVDMMQALNIQIDYIDADGD